MSNIGLIHRIYHEKQPHGDRATQLSDSQRQEIVLYRDGQEWVMHSIDQFDGFHCSIRPLAQTVTQVNACILRYVQLLRLSRYHIENYQPRTVTSWQKASQYAVPASELLAALKEA